MKKNTLGSCGVLALALLALLSCKKETVPSNGTTAVEIVETVKETDTVTTPEKDDITWEVMKELPNAVKETTCTFSADPEAFKNQQFLYGDNGNVAFVQLDGKRRRLVSLNFEEKGNRLVVKSFHDGFYTMKVEAQYEEATQEAQEYFNVTATITITAKDGRTVTKNVVGACGT